ncbi:MAG: phosphatase PAP2 family protein [Eubacteriales bacterium]|nr:phosphatase PAP2 family protein [Eubacteriales bacterium]
MDIEYLLILQNLRNAVGSSLNSFFIFLTNISVDHYILVPALILFWSVDKRKGSRVLMSWGTSLAMCALLKSTFCVYRPWIRDSRVQPAEEVLSGATGYSFPSGHSFSAGGFWGGIGLVYRKYRGIVAFCIVYILLVMFSRNYLGVHTPQDVLVGGVFSLFCAIASVKLCNYLDSHPDKGVLVFVIITLMTVILLLYIALKPYPEDYVNGVILVDPRKMTVDGFKDPGRFYGIFLGLFLEKRFVKFSTDVSTDKKVVRALFGAMLTIIWWLAVANPVGKLIGTNWGYFITQASTPLIFMTLYPMLFTRLEAKKD